MGEGEDAQLSSQKDTVTVGGYSAAHLSLVAVPDGGGVDHPLSPLSSAAAVSQHHSSHDKGIHDINYQQNF